MEQNQAKTAMNWFPGHMAKTKRELKESIKLVDLIVEIVDSRIIFSSRNKDFNEICGDKPRLIVLNKTDLVTHEDSVKQVSYMITYYISISDKVFNFWNCDIFILKIV